MLAGVAKINAAIRGSLATVFGAKAVAPVRSTPSLMYSFGMNGGYQPHEPFAGAWQRNITNANARDPNILAFSGVYACVTIISQDIAKLLLQVLLLGDDGVTEKPHTRSPYNRVLKKPNRYQTRVDFVQFFVACRLLRGNAYIFKEMDERGVPRALHILHPDRVQVLVDSVGKNVFYQFTPHTNDLFDMSAFGTNEGTVIIPSRFIIHDRINCLWHPLIGTSPLFAAAVTAMTGARILMNSESLFANMARPSGMLTAPNTISDVTAERLKRDFEANYSAGNFGRTAVLGDGLEWKAMVMTSTDAQLIEQLKWTIEDVARAFRVPMYLLADLTKMTYKNNEQAAQSYFSGCLQYHIESIEARLTDDFGLNDEFEYVAFDIRSMFRMDMLERFGAYKEGIAAGVLAPNEARRWEHLGPVKGGEEPRMQMQYVPLSTPIADPNAAAPAPAPAPAPEPADDANEGAEDAAKAVADTTRAEARAEMVALMHRVSAGAARAKFAFEERQYE
jgi:HK97 family phage portal protein